MFPNYYSGGIDRSVVKRDLSLNIFICRTNYNVFSVPRKLSVGKNHFEECIESGVEIISVRDDHSCM